MNCSFNIRYKPRTTRVFTKSDLTVYDSADNTALNALTVYGKSEVVDGAIVSAGEGGSIEVQTYTGTNQFGGLDFAQKLNIASNISVINTTDKTVTFQRRSDITPIVYDNFKPNTQYTFIMTYSNTSLNNCLRIKYDTGIDDVFEFTASNTKSTIVLTTDSARNVKQLYLTFYSAGETTLYYDECGIFEGVKTASDFEPYTGTMATFTTGTPLRGIPDTNVRDVMAWDGSSGAVTKNCSVENLGTRTWNVAGEADHTFYMGLYGVNQQSDTVITNADYTQVYSIDELAATDKSFLRRLNTTIILFRDTTYTEASDFKTAMSGKTIVYELAVPTTQTLTSTENASIAGLRTFTPQTHAQNNAGAEMTVDYTIRVPTI